MASPIDNGVEAKTAPGMSNSDSENEKHVVEKSGINAVVTGLFDETVTDNDAGSDTAILDTAEGVATYLLPMRDDFKPAMTFRSLFLASCLATF